jgi:uncharacterized membrane protein YgcG
MSRPRRGVLGLVLLCVVPALAARDDEAPRVPVGALDLAGLLGDDGAERVTSACREVLQSAALSVAVVIETDDPAPPKPERRRGRRATPPPPAPAPPGPPAQRWLKTWLAQPPPEPPEPPEEEAKGADGDAAKELTEPEPEPSEQRLVIHLKLAGPTLDVAVTPRLNLLLPAVRVKDIARVRLEPALASRNVDRIANALVATVEALGRVVTGGKVTAEASDEPVGTASFQPAPTPWWTSPWWLVGLPTLLFVLAAWWRVGLATALAWLPLLLLLYGGLYLWVLFRPSLLWLFGGAAVAPLVMLLTAPKAPARLRPRPVGATTGGFGTSGFGALGLRRGTV